MSAKDVTTQDEKLIAGLAHGSIILPMWGLIVSGFILVTQRKTSSFTREEAAQAVAWQGTLIVLFMVGSACYMLSLFGIVGISLFTGGQLSGGSPSSFFLPVGVIALMTLITLLFVIVGLFGAARALQGRGFRYPIVGEVMARYLAQE